MESLGTHLDGLGVEVTWSRETAAANADGGYNAPVRAPLDVPDPRVLLNPSGATVHELPSGAVAAGEATVTTTRAAAARIQNGDRFTTPDGENYVIYGPVSRSNVFDAVVWHAEREP